MGVAPPNNGMKLTGSATLNLPRPPQLIPVFGGPVGVGGAVTKQRIALPPNRRQLGVLALGFAGLMVVVMFPPWLAVTNWADGHADRDPIGHHFVLAPPGPAIPEELRDTVEKRRRAGAILYGGPDFMSSTPLALSFRLEF
jgi:hypothetical protein